MTPLPGNRRRFVNAHIIPEGFFRRLRDGTTTPRLISNTPDTFPQPAPIGVYDAAILCDSCEPLFGEWDEYAQQMLRAEPGGVPHILPDDTVVGWELPEYRYDLLKLFFVSVLWRASVSTRYFYRRVKAGPFEDVAKRMIQARDPGPPEQFAVTVARLAGPLGATILDPHTDRSENVNYYRFYFGGYIGYIKVDRRPPPAMPFGPFVLRPNAPLKIIQRDPFQSKEGDVVLDILEGPNNALARERRKPRPIP
jgi:hypothetical protein